MSHITQEQANALLLEALEPLEKLFMDFQKQHDGPLPASFEAVISTKDARRAAYVAGDARAALAQPAKPTEPIVPLMVLALKESRMRLEWFVDSYPHDITLSKAQFFAGIDEALAAAKERT